MFTEALRRKEVRAEVTASVIRIAATENRGGSLREPPLILLRKNIICRY